MPLYDWIDKKTGYKVVLLRPFAEYDVPPCDEDLPEDERGKDREWQKQLGEGVQTVRGPNWTGSKGNW